MSSIDSTIKRVIRVKRKANEEKSISNKRCKYIGSCHTNEDQQIHQLLITTQTLPQTVIEDQNNRLEITDYEQLQQFIDSIDDQHFQQKINSNKSNEIVTCNGEPLEMVDNHLSQTFEYIYDIYIYENDESVEQNDYRECDDEEVSSNDENYAYNDYPDEYEVSEEVFDYYNYRDDESDGQTDLSRNFRRTRISSDYDLNDEEESPHKYGKSSSDEEQDE